jgi:flavin-dependent dehydrogenase
MFGYFPGIEQAGYRWYYKPGVSAGVIPTNGGQHCVFVAMPPARFRAMARQDINLAFRTVLMEAAPDIASTLPPAASEALVSFPGRKGFLRRPCGPGWALIGDAGYYKDPLTAHGITDALRDAELLAQAVVGDTAAAMAGFAECRDALSRPLFHTTEAIASFDWDLDSIRRHHHALNLAMKQETNWLASLPVCPPRGNSLSSPLPQQENAA